MASERESGSDLPVLEGDLEERPSALGCKVEVKGLLRSRAAQRGISLSLHSLHPTAVKSAPGISSLPQAICFLTGQRADQITAIQVLQPISAYLPALG